MPAIVRLPEIDFIDDKAGNPVDIHKFIGRRPIAALENSDGDFEMLEWTTAGPERWLGFLVHHDDPIASTPMIGTPNSDDLLAATTRREHAAGKR